MYSDLEFNLSMHYEGTEEMIIPNSQESLRKFTSTEFMACPPRFIQADPVVHVHENPLAEFFHLLSIQEFDCCKAILGI